jgi:hydroxymethylbilane synthase
MLFRLPSGATVGTSSPRRIAQLMRFRPDLRPVPLRGNVTGRISAVSAGRANAVILALAGLERLSFSPAGGMGVYPLPLDHFVPAAGQGALAVVCRKGYLTQDVKRRATDRTTAGEVGIERRLLFELSAGCNKPLGISAVSFGRGYTIRLQLLATDGTKEAKLTAGVAADSDTTNLISSFERIRMSRFGE